jgi:hypothetical protein
MAPKPEVSKPRLPNFLVIGARKTWTTSLCHALRQHPQIFMPDAKEIGFFNPLQYWGRGVQWYGQQFAEAPPFALMIGEHQRAIRSSSGSKLRHYLGSYFDGWVLA